MTGQDRGESRQCHLARQLPPASWHDYFISRNHLQFEVDASPERNSATTSRAQTPETGATEDPRESLRVEIPLTPAQEEAIATQLARKRRWPETMTDAEARVFLRATRLDQELRDREASIPYGRRPRCAECLRLEAEPGKAVCLPCFTDARERLAEERGQRKGWAEAVAFYGLEDQASE